MRSAKLVLGDEIRRTEIPPRTPLSTLVSTVQSVFTLPEAPTLKFVDAEGDPTTFSNDSDIDFAFDVAASSKKILKIEVVPKRGEPKPPSNEDDIDVDDMYEKEEASGVEPGLPVEQEEEEDPLNVLARFLNDKTNVDALFEVFTSDAVANSVSRLAGFYLSRSEDPLGCISSAMDEFAVLKAIVETSIESKPAISATLSKIAESMCCRIFAEIRSNLFSEFCNNDNGTHPQVMCDSCEADTDACRRSVSAGTRDASSGCIKGIRYKSVSVRNYDLCETCEATRRFDSSHGPFVKIRQAGDCPPRPWRPRWAQHCGPMPPHCGPFVPPHCGPVHPPPHCRPGHHPGHHHHHHHGGHHGGGHHPDGDEGYRKKSNRGCRGSRRQANFKENLVEVASDFFERFRGRAQEFGGDIASAVEASLQDLAKEAERAKERTKAEEVKPEEEPLLSSDWVRTEEAVDPMEKWAEELSVLNRIGFADDVEMALRMLEEENGNLERVVARIASVRA